MLYLRFWGWFCGGPLLLLFYCKPRVSADAEGVMPPTAPAFCPYMIAGLLFKIDGFGGLESLRSLVKPAAPRRCAFTSTCCF